MPVVAVRCHATAVAWQRFRHTALSIRKHLGHDAAARPTDNRVNKTSERRLGPHATGDDTVTPPAARPAPALPYTVAAVPPVRHSCDALCSRGDCPWRLPPISSEITTHIVVERVSRVWEQASYTLTGDLPDDTSPDLIEQEAKAAARHHHDENSYPSSLEWSEERTARQKTPPS